MGKPGPEDIVEDSAVKEVRKPESDNRENIVDPNNENVVNPGKKLNLKMLLVREKHKSPRKTRTRR